MILSFHPCFSGDTNILCAGREPGAEDLAAIKASDAVILPQGCYQSLFEMAHNNCTNVFPNFNARFKYEGKLGQVKLFEETNVKYPKTETYRSIDDFFKHHRNRKTKLSFDFPFVFKLNWGGEGNQVYLIESYEKFETTLNIAKSYEKSGQTGFLLQEHIETQNRSIRVAVIGQTLISYWCIQKNTERFCTNLAKGAVIDADVDKDLQSLAVSSVKDFCKRTGINLAGFDLLFSSEAEINTPVFLEINYYFGRRGLGGAEKFYEILNAEIKRWIDSLGLALKH
jgi:ribosomal protein S6--L-glutamate ligase